jgi:hypothetical protein
MCGGLLSRRWQQWRVLLLHFFCWWLAARGDDVVGGLCAHGVTEQLSVCAAWWAVMHAHCGTLEV